MGRFIRSRDALDALVYEELALRRAESNGDVRDDVLSLLMRAQHDDGSPLTDRELCDELVTVVGAGHETTATALAWAVERLVRHPEAMERLRADEDGADADAVIRETLRARPVIVDVARKLTTPLRIAGYDLPAGTLVLASITGLHAREDLYANAAAFRPERFLDEPPGTYTWIPFGGGVRRCLGAAFAQEEMRIVLREIATRADLRATDPTPERPRMRNVTIAPEHGARVVTRRPLAGSGKPAALSGKPPMAWQPPAGEIPQCPRLFEYAGVAASQVLIAFGSAPSSPVRPAATPSVTTSPRSRSSARPT